MLSSGRHGTPVWTDLRAGRAPRSGRRREPSRRRAARGADRGQRARRRTDRDRQRLRPRLFAAAGPRPRHSLRLVPGDVALLPRQHRRRGAGFLRAAGVRVDARLLRRAADHLRHDLRGPSGGRSGGGGRGARPARAPLVPAGQAGARRRPLAGRRLRPGGRGPDPRGGGVRHLPGDVAHRVDDAGGTEHPHPRPGGEPGRRAVAADDPVPHEPRIPAPRRRRPPAGPEPALHAVAGRSGGGAGGVRGRRAAAPAGRRRHGVRAPADRRCRRHGDRRVRQRTAGAGAPLSVPAGGDSAADAVAALCDPHLRDRHRTGQLQPARPRLEPRQRLPPVHRAGRGPRVPHGDRGAGRRR